MSPLKGSNSKTVIEEAMDGDYDHLLATIMTYCEPKDEEELNGNEQ